MERMEVDPCACAVGGAGGGALRRSNSAPMITSVRCRGGTEDMKSVGARDEDAEERLRGSRGFLWWFDDVCVVLCVSDGTTVFSSSSSARFRRSSVSVNPSGPSQLLPLSPFPLNTDRTEHKRHEENMEMTLRGSLHRLSSSSLLPAAAASHWSHSNSWSHAQDSGVTPNSSPSPTRRFRPSVSAVRWPPVAPLKRKGGVESDAPPKKLFVAGVSEPLHRSSAYTLSVSEPSDESPPLSTAPPFASFSPHQH